MLHVNRLDLETVMQLYAYITVCLVSREDLNKTSQDLSVSKSNRLHVMTFVFSSIIISTVYSIDSSKIDGWFS